MYTTFVRTHDDELRMAVGIFALTANACNSDLICSSEDEEDELCDFLIKIIVNEENTYPDFLIYVSLGMLYYLSRHIDLSERISKSEISSVLIKQLSILIPDLKENMYSTETYYIPPSCSDDIDKLYPPLSELKISKGIVISNKVFYSLEILSFIGEYQDVIAPVLIGGGVNIFHELLLIDDVDIVMRVLNAISSLAVHQKFSSIIVEKEIKILLTNIPQMDPKVLPELAECLNSLFSHPTVVDETCERSPSVVKELLNFSLKYIESKPITVRYISHFLSRLLENKSCVFIFEEEKLFEQLLDSYDKILNNILKEREEEEEEEEPNEDEEAFGEEENEEQSFDTMDMALELNEDGETSEGAMDVEVGVEGIDDYDGDDMDHEEIFLNFGRQDFDFLDKEDNDEQESIRKTIVYLSTAIFNYLAILLIEYKFPNDTTNITVMKHKTTSPTIEELKEPIRKLKNNKGILFIPDYHILNEKSIIETLVRIIYESEKSSLRISGEAKFIILKILWIVTAWKNGNKQFREMQITPLSPHEPDVSEIQPIKPLSIMLMLLTSNTNLNIIYCSLLIIANFVKPPKPTKLHPSRRISDSGAYSRISDNPTDTSKLIRSVNGVSTLLSFLDSQFFWEHTKGTSPSINDIRAEASYILHGLSRDKTIRQVLSKKLSRMTKDLVKDLTSKNIDNYESFQRYKNTLFDLYKYVTGKDLEKSLKDVSFSSDHALTKMERENIVQNTFIDYSSQELLELVYKHLISQGLTKSAHTLLEEANLDKSLLKSSSQRRKRSLSNDLSFKNKKSNTLEYPLNENGFIDKKEEFTLDLIVRQFLYDQHKLCTKPTQLLTRLSLKHKHECPVNKSQKMMMSNNPAKNVTRRILQQQIGVPYRQLESQWRKYKYSRLKPLRLRYEDEESQLCSVAFINNTTLYASTTEGVGLKLVIDGDDFIIEDDWLFSERQTYIDSSYTNDYLLTYCMENSPNTVKLWKKEKMHEPVKEHRGNCGSFSPIGDKYVISNRNTLTIYDIQTLSPVIELMNTMIHDKHSIMKPCFSPDGALLLNNSTIWDCRQPKPIHKFDKFSKAGPEVFSSNGLEIIIGTEIWDVRSFKLLKTCPSLEKTTVKFNREGDVMFALYEQPRSKVLKVLDALNYDLITEQYCDNYLYDISIHPDSTSFVLVESDGGLYGKTFCRLWDIGLKKSEGDPRSDEETDEEDDEGRELVSYLLPHQFFDSNESISSEFDDNIESLDDLSFVEEQ